jgi:hypothetical protein
MPLRILVPGVGGPLVVSAYGSDAVARAARASASSLIGLAGLPLLREFQFAGDANSFWIQQPRAAGP